ncbi:MAG: hypothetical protein J0I16_26635 [Rhizobiales bacterium]|nr:hypothetical protein [Hyphomicrobiales bacterium]
MSAVRYHVELKPDVMQSIRTIRDPAATPMQRTRAAYILWAWSTVATARRSIQEIKTIYESTVVINERKSLLAEIGKQAPTQRKVVSDLVRRHKRLARWSLNYVISKQWEEKYLLALAKLTEAYMRLLYIGAKEKSFERALRDSGGGQIGNTREAKEAKKSWYSQMPFVWAAREAGLPFIDGFPHEIKGKNESIYSEPLPLDLFSKAAGELQLDNVKIENYFRYLRWALTVWPRSLDEKVLRDLFGDLEPLVPPRMIADKEKEDRKRKYQIKSRRSKAKPKARKGR